MLQKLYITGCQLNDYTLFQSIASIKDNVITVTSKTAEGHDAGFRTFTFSDSGIELVSLKEKAYQNEITITNKSRHTNSTQ